MATRKSLAKRALDAVGSDRLQVVDLGRGWPARVLFRHEGHDVPIALFVGPIGDAHRAKRRHIERRWQNPAAPKGSPQKGLPIEIPANHFPLLLGTWFEDPFLDVRRPVLAVADANRRVGKTTRHSIFAEVAMLSAAADSGWAEGANGEGEPVTYFHPSLLPAFIDLALLAVDFPTERLTEIAQASGITEHDEPENRRRARRLAEVVVRDSRFGKSVVDAYDGLCAMCGLNLGIVEGAHIYPASAPHSPDIVPNGIALCPNHHAAFDRHKIAIDPESLEVRVHPELATLRHRSEMSAFFIDQTVPVLRRPSNAEDRPNPRFILRRIELYGERLSWAY